MILYPSSKHTALVKNLHQYALQQKITLLPLVSREVQPAIIPLKQHSHIKRNQVVNLNQRVQFLTHSHLLLYYKAPEQFEKKHLPRTTKSAVCSIRCSIFVN